MISNSAAPPRGQHFSSMEKNMLLAVQTRGRVLEYCLLNGTQPAGPKIGDYRGQPIHESVVDEFGRRFVFVGVATRYPNGALNPDVLRTGEFILRPGLVYRMVRLKWAATASTLCHRWVHVHEN